VTLEHVLMLMQASPVQFVDARAAHEFAVSRIPGAVHVSPDMFAAGAPAAALALDRSLPIIVYCTGGQCESSLLVAIRLREMGYGQLSVYEDGMEGWTKAGQPVDTSPGPGSGPAGGGR
jgi:rhodanese-related sulfurtransferase